MFEFCANSVLSGGSVPHIYVHFCLHAALFMRQNLVVRKTCRTFALQRAEMPFVDVPWCNGSTRVFGSLSPRSNRSGTTSPSPRVLQSFPACKALFPQQCLYDTAFLCMCVRVVGKNSMVYNSLHFCLFLLRINGCLFCKLTTCG